LATFTRLSSGSWRVQVRRKGKYVNETFLRRKDAEEWALDVERRVDRGDPALTGSSREARTFGNLIALHREDLKEVGKPIGRSKAASLNLLEKRLGRAATSGARSRTAHPIRKGAGAGRRWPGHSRYRSRIHQDHLVARGSSSRGNTLDRARRSGAGRARAPWSRW